MARRLLEADLDANGHAITALITAVNASDAVPFGQMTAAIAIETAARIATDLDLANHLIEADDATDLSAAAFPASGLVLAKVEVFEDLFYLDRGNTQTADGITIIMALGGVGRWIRMNIANTVWQAKTAWYWHPTLGDDTNTGDIGFPVKTHAEIDRRCGNGTVISDTTIHLLANTTEVPVIHRLGGGGNLYYTSTPTVIASGTVTSTVAENKAANTQLSITDSGMSGSWTPFVGQPVRFFSGATPVGTAYVAKDLGSKTAALGSLRNESDTPSLLGFGIGDSPGTVASGNTYQVLQHFALPAPVLLTSCIVIYHGTAINTSALGSGFFLINFSEISGSFTFAQNVETWLTFVSSTSTTIDTNAGARARITYGVFRSGGLPVRVNGTFLLNDCRFYGSSLSFSNSSLSFGPSPSGDVGFFDSAGATISLINSIVTVGLLWGSGNTISAPVQIHGNGSILALGSTPVVNGVGGVDYALNGASHTWAEGFPVGSLATQCFVTAAGA